MNYISKWCLLCGKDHQGFDKKNWWRMVRKDELGNFWVGQPSTGTLLIKEKVVIGSSEEIFLVRNILDETVVGWVCQPSWQRAENVVNISTLNTQEQGREPKDSLYSLELADMKKENEMLKTNINSLETEISKIKLRLRLNSSQQRTLDNRTISSLSSPSSIYQALGIKKNVDGVNISSELIDTEFKKPLESMSERRIRTLLKSLEYPMRTVLEAFHSDALGLLQLYVDNIGSSSFKRTADMKYLAELPLVLDAVESYNSSNDPRERERILSFLSQEFTNKSLNDLPFEEKISWSRFSKARSHAAAFGVGKNSFMPQEIRRCRVNAVHFEEALKFISNSDNMQQVAFGSTELTLSNGDILKVPAALRRELRSHMWREYKKLHLNHQGEYSGGVGETKFYELSKLATSGGQLKTMAGLDNISQRFGNENFEKIIEF